MMQLTTHFTLAEMCATNTGLPNVPDDAAIFALNLLCHEVLEKVRAEFGPVTVTSGFRSPAVNRAVGSKAKASQHMLGEAADIKVKDAANADVWRFITSMLSFDQCIAEMVSETNPQQGWVHVSYRDGRNRREGLSYIGHGKYVRGLKFAS